MSGRAADRARLGRSFYRTDAATLARRLLGRRLVRVLDDGTRLAGIIVETEAYCGVEDRACHSYAGRRTPRNEAMYARAGTAYVYFTYGMHWCFNVVCGRKDEPVAVLIRALEPEEGEERMAEARGRPAKPGARVIRRLLTSGPARLCQALGIDRALNGEDLVRSRRLWIERGPAARPPTAIAAGPRIGVASAGEWAKKPLRFWVKGSPCVSR